jgi:hypothetical protein
MVSAVQSSFVARTSPVARRAVACVSLLGFLALGACATPSYLAEPTPPPPPPAPDMSAVLKDWRGVIVPADRDRYSRRAEAWSHALDQARRQPGSGDLASLGNLIDPAAALPNSEPPMGNYRCRTIKLGSQGGDDGLGYVVYGWFGCRIDRTPEGLRLTKLTGSQRPEGLLYPEDGRHMVFLGGMALASEHLPPAYGRQEARNLVGMVERIGEARWRLVLPWPRNESNLDILELVPVA